MNDSGQQIFIIDDNVSIRRSMGLLLDALSLPYRAFGSATEFLEFYDGTQKGCIVLDIRMPDMSGLELQQTLNELEAALPIIFVTGHGDVPMAVEAMRKGAFDFLRKPVNDQKLLDLIRMALAQESESRIAMDERARLCELIASLTPRQREVFERVADGQSNKFIASELGVSERTVEVHRSEVMRKLEARTLAELIKTKFRVEYFSPGA